MQPPNGLTLDQYAQACTWGALRGLAVTTACYPFDRVRIELQRHEKRERIPAIFTRLLREGGVPNLYTGLPLRLLQVLIKQPYSLPLLVHLPKSLERFKLPSWKVQLITGMTIGGIDAVFAAPIEWLIFGRIQREQRNTSLRELFAPRRILVSWVRSGSLWSTYSISLDYYRRQEKNPQIPVKRQIIIGAKTALWATLISGPLSFLVTMMQDRKYSLAELHVMIRREFAITRYGRGLSLIYLHMFLQNTSSTCLFEYLSSLGVKSKP